MNMQTIHTLKLNSYNTCVCFCLTIHQLFQT